MDLEKRTAIQLTAAFASINTALDAWGFILLDDEYDNDIELRNMIFSILFCALLDAIISKESWEADVVHYIDRSATALHYKTILDCYLSGLIDVFSDFEVGEIILVKDLREQITHGRLSRWHRREIGCHFVRDSEVMYQKFSNDDYWNLHWATFDSRSDNDAIGNIRNKFGLKRSLFWNINDTLRYSDIITIINEDLLKQSTPRIYLKFKNNNFFEAQEAMIEKGAKLFCFYDSSTTKTPKTADKFGPTRNGSSRARGY